MFQWIEKKFADRASMRERSDKGELAAALREVRDKFKLAALEARIARLETLIK